MSFRNIQRQNDGTEPLYTDLSANDSVLTYQQKCYREYLRSIELPEYYTYPSGNPIRPLPPIQTAVGGLMIVGAYPSARFESRPSRIHPKRNRLIPIADNLQPFGRERYFDGLRVRILESAEGLQKYLLSKLKIAPQQCWITDIVKVFLYKEEHVESCADVCPEFQAPELRSQFKNLAERSLTWLQNECRLCRPKLILTLGEEVAQVVSNELNAPADALLVRNITTASNLDGYPTLFLPHPDACRRFEKWRLRMEYGVEMIKSFLDDK